MYERNLLSKEIYSLDGNLELESDTAKQRLKGHIAWAKVTLNKLLGSTLTENNVIDTSFKQAVLTFQKAHHLQENGEVNFKTERALLDACGLVNVANSPNMKSIIVEAKQRIEDWTEKAIIPPKKIKLILPTFRDPRRITALVMHHMAFKRKDRAGKLSNPESYLAVGAHFCIMLDGRIMQHHPVSRMIWHAQCISPGSVGVEFEGNFPDINGKWWYPKDEKTKKIKKINEDRPTLAQYNSGRFLLSYLKAILGIKNVLAHRQSSDSRENDPGPEIWFNVGQWGINVLGLGDGGPDFKCGQGNPISSQWRSPVNF